MYCCSREPSGWRRRLRGGPLPWSLSLIHALLSSASTSLASGGVQRAVVTQLSSGSQFNSAPKHSEFSYSKLIWLLVAGLFALNLLVGALAGLSVYHSHNKYEAHAVTATQNWSFLLAQDLASSFDKIDLAVLAIKDETEREIAADGGVDAQRLNRFIALQASRQSDIDRVQVADARGAVLYGTGIQAGSEMNATDREFFQRLRDQPGSGLVISKPFVGRTSGKWNIVLARRINQQNGSFAGVALAVIFLERFQKAFAKLDLGPHGAVSLRDLDLGTVVRHPEPQEVGTAVGSRVFSKEWPQKLKENPLFGSYYAVGLDGRNRALSYQRVRNYPFLLIVGLFPGDYLADWRAELQKTLGLVFLFMLVTVFLGLAMRAVWKRREEDSKHLLNISQTALGHSEGRFQQLAESMPQIAFTTQPDGNRDYVNSRWQEYVGAPLREALGWGWLNAAHPEDKSSIEANWQRGLATGEPIYSECRVKSAKGEYRWHLVRALPVRDSAGVISKWVGTSTDIDDAKRLQQKLATDDKKKDEFIATLAHELRNPLAPIRNALHIMRLSTERRVQDESRSMIERQVEHLVRLVDDLFDMSRITQGRLGLHTQRVDLRSVLQDAIAASRLRIEKQKHTLTATLPQAPVLVNGDATRLAQVVTNLLNNAARYTPDGGQIALRASCEGNDVVLSVRDNGIGIPEGMLSKIFDMFTQGERLENHLGGMGIGLTLVKQIVEMHGGRVEARSEGPACGAEFVVRLPIVVPERRRVPRTSESDLHNTQRRRRVLVVDDNSDSVSSFAMMLDLMGHETAVANDGDEALLVAEAFRPDVIFLDIGLPKVNGHDVARAIRARPWGKDIVLIALSGWGQPDDMRRSLDAGFNHHLAKPAERGEVERLLQRGGSAIAGGTPSVPDAPNVV